MVCLLTMDWERHHNLLSAVHWVVLLVLSASSYFLTDTSFTLGVILGGLVVIANFNLMQHSILGAFSAQAVTEKTKVSIIAKFYLRLLALGLILYLLTRWEWVKPIGLMIGLSTVFLSMITFAILRALGAKDRKGA